MTKEKFLKYEQVRLSGVTNMFHVSRVMDISKLTFEECIDIQENYRRYSKEFINKKD